MCTGTLTVYSLFCVCVNPLIFKDYRMDLFWIYSHFNRCRRAVLLKCLECRKCFIAEATGSENSTSCSHSSPVSGSVIFWSSFCPRLSRRTFLRNLEASPWRPSPGCGRCAEHGLPPRNLDSCALNALDIPDLYLHCAVIIIIIVFFPSWLITKWRESWCRYEVRYVLTCNTTGNPGHVHI